MPLAGYFRNVGAVLLALLFIADFCLPSSPVVQRGPAYPPVIRIHSDKKWPARVIFDTTQVLVIAVAAVPSAGNAPVPPVAGDVPASQASTSAVREALALLPRPDARHAELVEQGKRHWVPRQAVRSTRKHPKRVVVAARQGAVGWFGFGHW